jgi:oligopeptide transport system permease protein
VRKISFVYLIFCLLITVVWKMGGLFTPMNPASSQVLLLPSWQHIFGTDALGRDLAGRILEGGFVSFSVGMLASAASMLIAVFWGVLWTWFRPKDSVVLLMMDIMQALPGYVTSALVFLLIQSFFPTATGTLTALTLALAISHWMTPARILRAQTLQLLRSPFVEASRGLGATGWHILKWHAAVHVRRSFFMLWALQIPLLLMYESFMSFIGFGVEAPYTSWGLLLQDGWRFLSDYPHLLLGPAFVLFTVLMAANYLFDSVRYNELYR